MKALLFVAGIAVVDAASAAAAELPTYQLMGLSITARRTRPAVPPGCRRPRPWSSSTRARRPRPHTSRKRYVGGELCFLDQNSRAAAQRAFEIFRRFPVVPRLSAQLGLARWSLMGVPAPWSELQAAAVSWISPRAVLDRTAESRSSHRYLRLATFRSVEIGLVMKQMIL